MSFEDQLYDIERKLWTGGPDVFRAHTDGTCLAVFTEMVGLLERESIAQMAQGDRWREVQMDRKGFLQPTEMAAIISYEAGARRTDGRRYRALVSTAYVRRGNEWKMAFHQQTPLSPA